MKITTLLAAVSLVIAPGFAVTAAAADADVLLRPVSVHETVQLFSKNVATVKCPAGHIPVALGISRSHPDILLIDAVTFIDNKGAPVDFASLTNAASLIGGGYNVTLTNDEDEGPVEQGEVTALCASLAGTSDNSVVLTRRSQLIEAETEADVNVFCSADHPAGIAGFSNANPVFSTHEMSTAPVWGSEASPRSLADLADGQTDAPSGWASKIRNASGAPATFTAFAFCANIPQAKTFVYSTAGAPGEAFSVFAPVPNGWTALSAGFDGGAYGTNAHPDMWTADGVVLDQQQFYGTTTRYEPAATPVRAIIWRSSADNDAYAKLVRPAQSARAVVGLLAVPQAGAPAAPSVVSVVEFYNAALDHYFITAASQEIADLDAGVHKGWARTGQSFNAYRVGSTGSNTRRPVCRIYGIPSAGLDSHFYSASADECLATSIRLSYAWIMESDEVFEMDLPDAASGACPNATVPVYRLWNGRADSNHRYTTSTAIRDQMLAKHYVAEGYGPNSVALCALQ